MTLLQSQQHAKAIAACEGLKNKFPQVTETHYLLALGFVEAGRLAPAVQHAEKAYKMEPGNHHYVFYLGYIYQELGLPEFALPLLRQALKLQPGKAEYTEVMGQCYFSLNKSDEAVTYYKRALNQNPKPLIAKRIRMKLIYSLGSSNRNAEALPLINKLLQGDGEAYAAACVEAALAGSNGVNSLEGDRLTKLLNGDTITEERRIQIYLALGKLHARDNNHEEAFKHWEMARALGRATNWNLRNHAKKSQSLKEFYTKELFDAVQAYGHPSQAPVFVVGMPRSGTTLTEQIISNHPLASGVGELARWERVDDAFQRDYPAQDRLKRLVENAKRGELKARAQETLNAFVAIADGLRARVIEKTPHNFINVGFHRMCFPNAKFVHCQRDPRDTFISAFQQHFASYHGYIFDQAEYVKEYLFHEEMMSYWKSLFPNQVFTLKYETLVQDPEATVRKLLAFVGLEWDEACLKFHESSRTVRTFSKDQVRRAVNTSSLAQWQKYEKHLGPLLSALDAANFKYD